MDLPPELLARWSESSETATPEEVLQLFAKWRSDPNAFAADLFEPLRDFQPNVLRLVAANRTIAVKASRGSGKTRAAAVVALWFLVCFEGSLVLVVAPTFSQAQNLWREIQGLWFASQLPKIFRQWEVLEGEIRTTKPTWRMKLVSAESGERIEGAHGAGVLLVLDEAKAVPDHVFFSAIGSLGDSPHSRIVAISTAGLPLGWFYRAFSSDRDRWGATLSVSASEVPRLRAAAEEARQLLGEHNPLYRAQYLSEFSGATEQPFFNLAKLERAIERPYEPDSEPRVFGIDVARLGRDKSIIAVRRGDRLERFIELPPADLMTTTGAIMDWVRRINDPHPSILVTDATGIGAGVHDRLVEVLEETGIARRGPLDAVAFLAGGACDDEDARQRFANRKTEAAMTLFVRAEQERLSIPNHPRFIAEMMSYQLKISSAGKMKLDDGDGKSPDFGDAAICAFSLEGAHRAGVQTFNPWWLGY